MAVFEGLAVLAAKVASASTVVQATAGLGIAVAGVTGAGAAGILPGPVQDGVAAAIESVTPFDLPDSADDRATEAVETRDSKVDGPGDVPGIETTDAPSSTPAAETTHSPEPGDDDGIHQNRGGRVESTTAAVRTDNSGPGSVNSGRDHDEDDSTAGTSSTATHSAEVEDHEDDDSGHHGGDDDSDDDNSGSGSGSDSSGHGGGSDDD
ncbi:MAG TPA: hypothetical protein VK402_20475 [Blastococcus sp.]|nr:hypothetical protein [Blastococcus sp.]